MSSKETLERILAKDNIGDLYRAYAVSKRLFWGSLLSGLGATGIYYGTYRIINTDLHPGQFVMVGAGLISGFYGVCNLYRGIKATKGYLNGEVKEDGFYYLDGRISTKETAVERVFGGGVHPIESLNELGGEKGTDAKKCPYKFIDNVVLKSYKQNNYSIFRSIPSDENYDIAMEDAEFTIQRGNEEKKFSFTFRGGASSDYKRLFESENKKIALVFSNFPETSEDEYYSFVPIKVYNPHP